MTKRLVVAGTFPVAGSVPSRSVALFEPGTGSWSGLGVGVFGDVRCLATMPNGNLAVGGTFTAAGGQPASGLAAWNGSAWSAIASPFASTSQLAVLPSGLLAATDGVGGLAFWNGANWTFDTPPGATNITRLLVAANGDLLVGTTTGVHRRSGLSWLSLGNPGHVLDLVEMPNGDVVAAGSFAGQVARFSGGGWAPVGNALSPVTAFVSSIVMQPNGRLLIAGSFSGSGATTLADLAELNGTQWTNPGGGIIGARHLHVWGNGEVFVGGQFATTQGIPFSGYPPLAVDNLARWSGISFAAVGPNVTDGQVTAMTRLPNGDIVVGGTFTRIWGTNAAYIARWDGVAWHPLGIGTGSPVMGLATMPNGDVIAVGAFNWAGGVQVNYVGRWNGSAWSSVGGGVSGIVEAVLVLPTGELVVTGQFASPGHMIAKWNGASWSSFGSGLAGNPNLPNKGRCLAVAPNGDIYVGGRFETANGVPAQNCARWNGTNWSSVGPATTFATQSIKAMTFDAGGRLVVVGENITGYSIAVHSWDGAAWSDIGGPYGPGLYPCLLPLPDGRTLLGGQYHYLSPPTVSRLIAWDGASWSHFLGVDANVNAMLLQPNGELVIGGEFRSVEGTVSRAFAEGVPTCPSNVNMLATACVGPAGPVALTATAMPFVGATYKAKATSFTASSFGVQVLGFSTTSVPLTLVDPSALPGCDLLVTPDLLSVVLPTAGVATYQWAIPNAVALGGLSLAHQVVQFDAIGTPTSSLSSSNALVLTIGSL